MSSSSNEEQPSVAAVEEVESVPAEQASTETWQQARQRRILEGTARAVYCNGRSCCQCEAKLTPLKAQFDAASQHTALANKYREGAGPIAGGRHTNRKGRKLWLLKNAFDAYGNFLFCQKKLASVLGVSVNTLYLMRKEVRETAHQGATTTPTTPTTTTTATTATTSTTATATTAMATPQHQASSGVVTDRKLVAHVLRDNLLERVIVPENAEFPVKESDVMQLVDPSNPRHIRAWLRAMPSDAIVEVVALSPVRYVHGNQGRRNRARDSARAHLRAFVETVAHPNGRSASYRGKTLFLEASILRLAPTELTGAEKQVPAKVEQREIKLRTSLLGRFNSYLEDVGEAKISSLTLLKWMSSDPMLKRVGVSPRRSDYCDACTVYKEQLCRARTRLARLRQRGNASAEKLRMFDLQIIGYETLNILHREEAARELRVFAERKAAIEELMRTRVYPARQEGEQRHNQARQSVPYMISVDFQMGRQVPHFSRTQPGRFYYRQSLVSHTFGIVDHNNTGAGGRTYSNHLYVSDEESVGTKDSNHVITCLNHFIGGINVHFRHLVIYLDAAPYFKNFTVLDWAYELVHRRRFNKVELCFMVPGHTKFDPDRLFSCVTAALNGYNQDFYSTRDIYETLRDKSVRTGIIDSVTLFGEDAAHCINDWKAALKPRFTKFVGITTYGRFVIERKPNQTIVLAAYRTNFDSIDNGTVISNFHNGGDPLPSGFCPSSTRDTGAWKPLKEKKCLNLLQTYREYIDSHRDRWPKFLRLVEADRERYFQQLPPPDIEDVEDDEDEGDQEQTSSSSSSMIDVEQESGDWNIYHGLTDPDALETGFDDALDVIVRSERILAVMASQDDDRTIGLKLARAHLLLCRKPNSNEANVWSAFNSSSIGLRNLPRTTANLSNSLWRTPSSSSSSSSSSPSLLPPSQQREQQQREQQQQPLSPPLPAPIVTCSVCSNHRAAELCASCNLLSICRHNRCGAYCLNCLVADSTGRRASKRRRRL
jgi:hypothetical protein